MRRIARCPLAVAAFGLACGFGAGCTEGRIVVDEGPVDASPTDAGAADGAQAAIALPTSCSNGAPCTPSTCHPVAPLGPVITDWSGTGATGRFAAPGGGSSAGDVIVSQPWVYPSDCPQAPQAYPLSMSLSPSHALRVTGTVGTWSGFGLWIGCMADLSAYGGLSFRIWGSAGPSATLTLAVSTGPDTSPQACMAGVGTCSPEAGVCASPSAVVPVPSSPGNPVTLRWKDFAGGGPQPAVDPSQIVTLMWSFGWVDWAGSRSEPYAVDVSLGDVTLVP